MLTVTTLNTNGIRAAMRKGMASWLRAAAPDILCLQEVRAPDQVLAQLVTGRALHAEACQVKGRAGVAIASLLPIEQTRTGVGLAGDVHTGRWVEASFAQPDLTVISAYVHSGQVGTVRQEQKMAFLKQMTRRLRRLAGRHRGRDSEQLTDALA